MSEYPKDIWKLQIKGKKKVEVVDRIYTELAKMYNIPKPNYCIYRIVTVKKLDESLGVMRSQICTYGGFLRYGEKCFIALIMRSSIVSKKNLLHEFGHYLGYVKNGYKPFDREESERKAVNFSENRRIRRLVNRIIYEMNEPD